MAAGANREIEPGGRQSVDPCHRRFRSHADAKVQGGRVTMRFLTALACASLLLAQRGPVRPPVEDAWALLAKGQRQAAIRLLHEIIGTHPGDADAGRLLGSVMAAESER